MSKITEIERIGLKMDDLLLDHDYSFPIEDVPVALSSNITYKEHSVWVKVYYPMIKVSLIEGEKRRELKRLYIGK